MRGDLYEDVGLRNVDGVVADLGEEDRVQGRVGLEAGQHARALRVGRPPVDEGPAQADRVLAQGEDVVRENNDLVPPHALVVVDQQGARPELGRVHHVEQRAAGAVFGAQVLPRKLLGQRAPDLGALHVGDVARPGQVQPVGLVELGPDEEVEVSDERVLPHERRGQAQLGVRLDDADDPPEHGGRDDVHLVQDEQAPLPGGELLHHPGGRVRAAATVGDHGVGRDGDAGLALKLLARVRRKAGDVMVLQVGPQLELMMRGGEGRASRKRG